MAFDPARTAVPALQAAVRGRRLRAGAGADRDGAEAEDRERAERGRGSWTRCKRRRRGRRAALGARRDREHAGRLFLGAGLAARSRACCSALTVPVQFWVGAEFHRGFLRDLRHRSASMATLVSLGTNAAFFFSVAVTLWPHVFHGGRRHDLLRDGGGGDHPRRRWDGGWRRAPAAHVGGHPPARRAWPRAPRACVGRASRSRSRPGRSRSATWSASVRASGSRSTACVIEGASAVDESMLTGESLPVDKASGATGVRRHA